MSGLICRKLVSSSKVQSMSSCKVFVNEYLCIFSGNDNLNVILRQGYYEVRFDLEDFTGDTSYAMYDTLHVGDESTNYRIFLAGYTNGTAGKTD